jgi:hypothetical protein
MMSSFGDQPPSQINDGGEVEPPVLHRQLDRQTDDLGKVPPVVVEDRA